MPGSSPGMTWREISLILQLPLVGRIIRLIDGELVNRGLPEMFCEPRRLQIDLALGDLLAERAIQLDQRAIRAEQLFQPRAFGSIAPLLQRQLARDEIQRVDTNAELESVVARDDGRDLVAEEIRDRLDQFGGCRFVLHLYFPLGANSLSKSISVSEDRRPIMARSIE